MCDRECDRVCDHADLVSPQFEVVQGPDFGFLPPGQDLVVGQFLGVECAAPLLPSQVLAEVHDVPCDVPCDVRVDVRGDAHCDEVRHVCVQLELEVLQETCRRILVVHRILHRRFLNLKCYLTIKMLRARH